MAIVVRIIGIFSQPKCDCCHRLKSSLSPVTTCGSPVTQLVEQIPCRQQWCNEQFTCRGPRQRVWTEMVTEYRQVPNQILENETAAVPVTVCREISVLVARRFLWLLSGEWLCLTVRFPAEP